MAASLAPTASRRWFQAIEDPALRPFVDANPLLPLKQLRVYLSTRWSRDRRLKVILDTYRAVSVRGGMLAHVLSGQGPRVLAKLCLEDGGGTVRLERDDRFRKEGELVVSLHAPGKGRVMSFAFALERARQGGLTLLVGCVQGEDETGAEIRSITKAMHGLRPRSFMVEVAQALAKALKAEELLGAGSSIQAHQRKHAIHLPRFHGLGFDYDAYWEEAGGQRGFDGWFRVPLAPARRSREEMKPNKRSMYAKRYQMLDGLHEAIAASL